MNCNPLAPSAVHSVNILPNGIGACRSRCSCALTHQKSRCVEWGTHLGASCWQLLQMVLEPPGWLAGGNGKLSVDCPAEEGSTVWFSSAPSQEMLCKPSLVSISRKHMTEAASEVGCRQG